MSTTEKKSLDELKTKKTTGTSKSSSTKKSTSTKKASTTKKATSTKKTSTAKKSTSTKKTTSASTKPATSSTSELRAKMDRLKKASDEINKDINVTSASDEDMSKVLEEKKQIENELKEAKKALRDLYALKYNEVAVIDEKNNALSSALVNELNKPTTDDNDKLTSLEKEKEELTAQIEKLKAQKTSTSLSKGSIKKVEELNEKLKESKQELAKANREKEKANAKLEELKEVNSQLKKDLNKSNNKFEKLSEKKTVTKVVKTVSDDNEEIKKLEEALALKEAKIKELKNQVASLNEEINSNQNDADNNLSSYEISKYEKENILIKAEFEKYKENHAEETEVNDQIHELNEMVSKLTSELDEKNALVLASSSNSASSAELASLSKQLEAKTNEVYKLQDEKKSLLEHSGNVEKLKEKIDILESDLGQKEAEINRLIASNGSVDSKELALVKNKYNALSANINQVEEEKAHLEDELKLAYKSLKEQDEIIQATDRLIAKQQSIIERKLANYNNQKGIITTSANIANDYEIQRLNNELEKAKDEINSLVATNASLVAENNKAKLSMSTSVVDVSKNEAHIAELETFLLNKNKECQFLLENYTKIQAEYNVIKNNREEELKEYKDKIVLLTAQLQAVNFSSEELELSRYNEERLKAQVKELESGAKLSAIIDAPSDETAIANLEEYKILLDNEKETSKQSIDFLNNEICELNVKFDDANTRLEKFSSDYEYQVLANQIESINDLIKDIKTKGTKINKDLYTDYYQELIGKYNDAKKAYDNEINKRNELLKDIKKAYQAETGEAKSKELNKQMKEIDALIASNVSLDAPMSCDKVEEAILKELKKDLQSYQKGIKENIEKLASKFNNKGYQLNSFDEFMNKYGNEYRKMAFDYLKEIKELETLNKFDNNEFTKFVRDEKILILINEFKTLLSIRNDKSNIDQSMFVDESAPTLQEEYAQALESYEAIKNNITLKMLSVQKNEEEANQIVKDEINNLNSDITNLQRQLIGLQRHEQDDLVRQDIEKANSLISSKRQRLDYLNNVKIGEIAKLYQEQKDNIEAEFNETLAKEEETKQLFEEKIKAMEESLLANKNRKVKGIDLSKYEEINKYLVNVEDIDKAFEAILNNREQTESIVKRNEERMVNEKKDSADFIKKYNALWANYEKLANVKEVLEEEFEEVRSYSIIMIEESGINRKINEYQHDIDIANESIKNGNNVSENRANIKVLTNKINALNSRTEFLESQAKKYLRNSQVSDYKDVCKKLNDVIATAKKYETDIKRIAK